MTRHLRVAALAAGVLLVASASRAQTVPQEWTRGTELGLFVGGATGASTTGAAVGAVAGWQITRLAAIEGRGSWFARGQGADGFSADISGLLNLVPKQTVTPYVGAGIGLYHASFASASSRMPAFYRNRMGPGGGGMPVGLSFTDPAFRLTTGVDVVAQRHLAFRPEASVLLVRSHGIHETMVTFGVRFAYRFEDHPVTPAK